MGKKKNPHNEKLASSIGYVDIDTSKVSENLKQARQQFDNFINGSGKMMQSWGSQIESFGQNLTLWTAPVSISLADAEGIRAAAEAERDLHSIGLNSLGNIPCIVEYQLSETESNLPKKTKRYKKGKWNKRLGY